MATPRTGVLPLTGDLLLDAMTNGFRWNDDAPIFYSISDGFNGEFWDDASYVGQQIQLLFGVIDYYVAADFQFLGYFADPAIAASAGSNINAAPDGYLISENLGDDVLAVGFFPNKLNTQINLGSLYYEGAEGDIFLNINSVANGYGFDPGQSGFSLALHEIGHTLGLKHPHDDGGTDRPTFTQSGIDVFNIDWLTVMSYEDTFNWNSNAWNPASPMILDVIALQHLYGVNLSTNAGDDTFVLVPNDGTYITIFDASGNDTLDLSGYTEGAYIDLPKYEVTETQFAPAGLITTLADRDRIDFYGSPQSLQWVLGYFENIIGSPYGDLIDGSDAAEIIFAGDGFDEIYVEGGNDTVDGGDGPDWVYFRATFAEATITTDGDAFIVESDLDGRNTLKNIEALVFDWDGTEDFRNISDLMLDVPEPPPADNWRLLAGDGQFVAVSGYGQVFGTQQFQGVSILDYPGTVSLDPSFNRGNNLVYLNGDAAEWQATVRGSSALLSDGDTFVLIPVGTAGLHLDFDDGQRMLRYDTDAQSVRIGSQTIGAEYAVIASPAQTLPFPSGYDANASGRLLLTSGTELVTGGNLDIFGTGETEYLTLLNGEYRFDPSFNKGGDTIHFVGEAEDFEASLVGSSVLIAKEDFSALIPVGASITTLDFFDADGPLVFDPGVGAVLIGDQAINATPATITFG